MERTNKFLLGVSATLVLLLMVTNLDLPGNLGGEITSKNLEEKAETVSVDFFVMSMCSHCIGFESVMGAVIGEIGDNIDFRVFYVLETDGEGVPVSPRGQEEIEENTRQLCINKHYPGMFFSYLSCVGEHFQAPQNVWEACAASNNIEPQVIEECSNGEEGKTLLEENIKKADYLGIKRSPMLMINKMFYTGKRTPNAVKDWICDEFENPPEGCSTDLEAQGITGLIIGEPSEGFCGYE